VRDREKAANTSPILTPLAEKVSAYKGRIGAIMPTPIMATETAMNRLIKTRLIDSLQFATQKP
jgi:hypothetical protein